jgi:hypothetical protein
MKVDFSINRSTRDSVSSCNDDSVLNTLSKALLLKSIICLTVCFWSIFASFLNVTIKKLSSIHEIRNENIVHPGSCTLSDASRSVSSGTSSVKYFRFEGLGLSYDSSPVLRIRERPVHKDP